MSPLELLDLIRHPAIRLFYMATGFWMSQALFVATDFEVFTILDSGELSADELCRALKLELRGCRALLSSLVSLGLLRFRKGRYSNSEVASDWLGKGEAEDLGNRIAM